MNRIQYDITEYNKLGLTPAVLMRRLTAISPYKHWHYFDAYSPGYLRALYRADGIKMPWSNIKVKNNAIKRLVCEIINYRSLLVNLNETRENPVNMNLIDTGSFKSENVFM